MTKPLRRFGALNWFGLAMSAVAMAWLAHNYDVGGMVAPMLGADYTRLPLVIGLVVGNFLLRAMRWRALIEPSNKPSFGLTFRTLMIGYLFNVLLPARAGDLVRTYEMGRRAGIAKGEVLATLALERLGDLLFLLVILAGVLIAYPALPAWAVNAGIVAAMASAGLTVFLVAMRFGGGVLLLRMIALMRRWVGEGFHDRLQRLTRSFVAGLGGAADVRRMAGFVLMTTALWLLEILIFHQVAAAFAVEIPLGNILFVILVVTVGTLVPSSPGFIGTYEYFGALALGIVGIGGSMALALIVAQHALVLLIPSLMGAVCLAGWPAERQAVTEALKTEHPLG